MPQLDLYTYFTQFQWLLIIFTALFILINNKYISSFQSLIEARNGLIEKIQKNEGDGNSQTLNPFGFEKSQINSIKPSSSSSIHKWDDSLLSLSSKPVRRRTKSNNSKGKSART